MNNLSYSFERVISDQDIDLDFEYNFDLNPFTYLLHGIHLLITQSYRHFLRLSKDISNRLHRVQEEQAYRRTFKGPACMMRK